MSANLIIREPAKADYDRIAELWYRSWLSTGLGQSSDVTMDDLRRRLENGGDWELLVAQRRGQIVGMLALRCSDAKLDQLFVAPDCQRQGIGRQLLIAAKERLPNGIWLKIYRQNNNALRFYQSQGFELDPERAGNRDAPGDVFCRWAPKPLN